MIKPPALLLGRCRKNTEALKGKLTIAFANVEKTAPLHLLQPVFVTEILGGGAVFPAGSIP